MGEVLKISQLRELHLLQELCLAALMEKQAIAARASERASEALARTQDLLADMSARISQLLLAQPLDTGAWTTLQRLHGALGSEAYRLAQVRTLADEQLRLAQKEYRICDARLANLAAELRRQDRAFKRKKAREAELVLLDRINSRGLEKSI